MSIAGCDRTPAAPIAGPTAAPALAPLDREAAIAAAEIALDDGRVSDAARLARYVAERDRSTRSLELLGRVLLAEAAGGRGDAAASLRDEAASAYLAAAELAPTNAGLHHAAAMVLDSVGRDADARTLHDRAVALAPDQPQHLLHRGHARLRSGDLDGAEDDLAAMIRVAPNEPWAHAFAAEVALARRAPEEAVRSASRARELAPRELAFRLLEARARRSAGRSNEAIELLSALDPTERTNEAATYELALAWMAIERPDKAAEAWEALQRVQPEHLRAALEAGRARLAAGDRLRASIWLDRAMTIDPSAPAVREFAVQLDEAHRSVVAPSGSP